MKEFICKHEDRIHGVLSCFDRMLFRGYLPIMSGWAMAQFLNGLELNGGSLKPFLLESSERVKDYAVAMAQKHGRPFQYLVSHIRKEDTARQLAERDGIEEGLVCIFSILEPCRTFSFRFKKGGFFVQSARRKCLHLYFYFMDRDFGLIHVRIQTWFPTQIQVQVYLNGHEWLARKLSANHIRYTKHDNVFLWIEGMAKAQTFADRFASLNWPTIHVYVRQSSPRQVHEHLESRRRQYERAEWAFEAGWARERILVIDEDQGKSGQLGLVRDRADPRRDEGIRRDQSGRGQRDARRTAPKPAHGSRGPALSQESGQRAAGALPRPTCRSRFAGVCSRRRRDGSDNYRSIDRTEMRG